MIFADIVTDIIGKFLEEKYGYFHDTEPDDEYRLNSYCYTVAKKGIMYFVTTHNRGGKGDMRKEILDGIAETLLSAGIISTRRVVGNNGASGHSCGSVTFYDDTGLECAVRYSSPSKTRDNGRKDEEFQKRRINETIDDEADLGENFIRIMDVLGTVHRINGVVMTDTKMCKRGCQPKADLILTGDIPLYISCKKESLNESGSIKKEERKKPGKMVHSYSGTSISKEPRISKSPIVSSFVRIVTQLYGKYGFISGDRVAYGPLSIDVQKWAMFGNDCGSAERGVDNVDCICLGNIDLIVDHIDEEGHRVYRIESSVSTIWQDTFEDMHETFTPYILAQYQGGYNSYGIKNCHIYIVPVAGVGESVERIAI